MESLTPIAHWLLLFVLGVVIASVLGSVSYAAMMLTGEDARLSFMVLCLVFVSFPSMALWFVALPVGALVGIVCVFPAYCEWWRDEKQWEWNWYFRGLFAATYQTIVVGIIVLLLFADQSVNVPWPLPLGFCFGLLLTPAAISIFRWMFHNSRLRPGIDRHLIEGDDPK